MQWITITADDLNDYQVGKIINAARTKALAAGQSDPFLKVMPDVVSNIRAKMRANPANRVSLTPNSVPPDLRSQTILLIIEKMQSRLPGIDLTDDFKTQIKDAKSDIEEIARKNNPRPIAVPDNPEPLPTVQRGGLIEEAQAGESGNSREDLERL